MVGMAELFDLYDAQGHPLGQRKERALVHRDGDWHRSIHLWIVRSGGALLFQRRSAEKDTWPGRLTASVGGHYAAGEALGEVLREAREELGVAATQRDLIPLGRIRWDDAPAPGIRDRELMEVFLWPLDLPLDGFAPDPAEVSQLLDIPCEGLLALLAGEAAMVSGRTLAHGSPRPLRVTVRPDDFVPVHDYHAQIACIARDYLAGKQLPPLRSPYQG